MCQIAEEFEKEKATLSSQVSTGKEKEKLSTSTEGENTTEKGECVYSVHLCVKLLCTSATSIIELFKCVHTLFSAGGLNLSHL